MKNAKKECEGCKAYKHDDQSIRCRLPSIKNGMECPCITCLVKAMCQTDQCDKFKVYLTKIWGPL